jgi:GxxExxY protein
MLLIIVDGKVLLEIKAVKGLSEIHEVQLVNYLKATGIEVGLLINFGRSVSIKRRIMDKNKSVQSV